MATESPASKRSHTAISAVASETEIRGIYNVSMRRRSAFHSCLIRHVEEWDSNLGWAIDEGKARHAKELGRLAARYRSPAVEFKDHELVGGMLQGFVSGVEQGYQILVEIDSSSRSIRTVCIGITCVTGSVPTMVDQPEQRPTRLPMSHGLVPQSILVLAERNGVVVRIEKCDGFIARTGRGRWPW